MAKITVELDASDRMALADSLVRLIAQTPQIVGTEINWIHRSVDSILHAFQQSGVEGLSGLSSSQIGKFLEDRTTPLSRGYSRGIAELMLVELAKFTERKASEEKRSGDTLANVVPTDKTHNFGIVAVDLLREGRVPEGFPRATFTEAEALALLQRNRRITGRDNFVLVAQPKVAAWTVLDYS